MKKTGAMACGVWLAIAPLLGAAPAGSIPDATEPNPSLTPADVVSIQLNALKHNDEPRPDHGIKITFNFASPANRKATGPLERFILMVKNPLYQPMLNYRSDEREPVRTEGDTASQKVVLVGADGKTAAYLFVLSKQKEAPYRNCWMTDSVVRVDDPFTPRKVA